MSAKDNATDPLIDQFADSLWLSDGLARNTIESYRRDITQLDAWLKKAGRGTIDRAALDDLQAFLAHRIETLHSSPRSTARLTSAMKRFYQFLLRERLTRRLLPAQTLRGERAVPDGLFIEHIHRMRGRALQQCRSTRVHAQVVAAQSRIEERIHIVGVLAEHEAQVVQAAFVIAGREARSGAVHEFEVGHHHGLAGRTSRRGIGEPSGHAFIGKGEHRIRGRAVDLGAIRCPVLTVTTSRDAICPPPAALALNDAAGTEDVSHVQIPGGHVGAVIGEKARTLLYPALESFFRRTACSSIN